MVAADILVKEARAGYGDICTYVSLRNLLQRISIRHLTWRGCYMHGTHGESMIYSN